MLTSLEREGRAFEIVYTSPSLSGIEAALGARFGVSVLARRIASSKLRPIEDDALPRLADVCVGVYVGEDARSFALKGIAARLAETLAPEPSARDAP
jgi:hypothetical protein